MRELSVNEMAMVAGGGPVAVATLAWTILLGAHEQLNDFGRGLGAGLYDGLN